MNITTLGKGETIVTDWPEPGDIVARISKISKGEYRGHWLVWKCAPFPIMIRTTRREALEALKRTTQGCSLIPSPMGLDSE